MFNIKHLSFVAVFCLCMTSLVSWAHHSAAGYDITSRVSITGELKKASFRNPHGTLKLTITGKDLGIDTVLEEVSSAGKDGEVWVVETAAANLLRRRGWKFKNVKKGHKVTLVGHPAKDGSPLLYLREIHMQDGTVFGDPKGQDKALD